MPNPFAYIDSKSLIRERDLARRWHKSVRTLQRWRSKKLGPHWHRIGVTVFYSVVDIHAFERARRHDGSEAQ